MKVIQCSKNLHVRNILLRNHPLSNFTSGLTSSSIWSYFISETLAGAVPREVEPPGSRGVLRDFQSPRGHASCECISKKSLSIHNSQSSCPPSRKSRFLAFGRSCALKARRASFSRRAGEHTSSFAPRQCRHAGVFRLEQLAETGRLVVDA